MVYADYTGATHTITASNSLSVLGKASGSYNIFLNPDGEMYMLNNTIYIQAARPNLIDNDIWLNTSCEPLRCIRYYNNTDSEFLDIPIGKVVVDSGVVSSIETNDFVSNGYDIVTFDRIPSYKYDFANPVSKSVGTTYTAECDGLLHVYGVNTNTTTALTIDGVRYTIHISSSQGSVAGGFAPVAKGQTYAASHGTFRFIPKIKITE